MRRSVFLAVALLGTAACNKDGTAEQASPTGTAPTCTPDPNVPNHPGCIEFVDRDGNSKIVSTTKFIDGKPVVKVVDTGSCILEIGPNGEDLRSTLLVPERGSQNGEGPHHPAAEPEPQEPPRSSGHGNMPFGDLPSKPTNTARAN